MNILISRHAGIGDIIMSLPIAFHLKKIGHDVSFAASWVYRDWLPEILSSSGIKYVIIDELDRHDYKSCYAGYDILLNFNKVQEVSTYMALRLHFPQSNYQYVMCLLTELNGLEAPTELAPSAYFSPPTIKRSDSIIICPVSKSKNRRIGNAVIETILSSIPNTSLVSNELSSVSELQTLISSSRAIICAESGPAHLAEITLTPCICLMSMSNHEKVFGRYKYVRSLQTSAKCSPCFLHDGCDNADCMDKFDVSNILSEIQAIESAVTC